MVMSGVGIKRRLGKSRAGKPAKQNCGRNRKSGFHREPPLEEMLSLTIRGTMRSPSPAGTKIQSPNHWAEHPRFYLPQSGPQSGKADLRLLAAEPF